MVALEPDVFTENGESNEREIRIQLKFDWFPGRVERLEESDTNHHFMAHPLPRGLRIWLLLNATTHSITEGVGKQDFGLQAILDNRMKITLRISKRRES